MSRAHPSVLHFIDTTGPGGAETVFLQVASGLHDRGWPARTVVVGPGWVLDNLRRLDLPADLVPTRGALDLQYLRRLAGLVDERGVALIQTHLFSPAVYGSAVGLWTGTPVVATFHGSSDVAAGSLGRRLRYGLISRRAHVVCVSESLRRQVTETHLVREERVHLIPNGVDLAAFARADGDEVRAEHGVQPETVLVGALGNVRPAKDYATLLRAAARLEDDHRFAFAIVGERTEPLFGELLRLRDELGLAERVSFWGFRRNVPDVIAAFDVLAISSRSEGFSLAAIQAMAAGTPVVATRSGGPEGIITDGVDGVLVPVGSPAALAEAIRRVADRPEWAGSLAKRGRQTVQERFSLGAMLDRYERLYSGVLEPGTSHSSAMPGTSVTSSSI